MPVGENVSFNTHLISDRSLRREPAAVYLWGDAFNNDAPASIRSFCHGNVTF